MALALRSRSDNAAALTPLAGLLVRLEEDPDAMALLQGRDRDDMIRRFDAGHRAYVADMNGIPAAWGWVATRSATIGELGVTMTIAATERYLWNFVTLPAYRGLGIYPRLLEAIMKAEADAQRFWVAYAPENHASATGIRRAGFEPISEFSFDEVGRPAVADIRSGGAHLAAEFLGVRETSAVLAQCWRCARAQKPKEMSCAEGECECDYQVQLSGCAVE